MISSRESGDSISGSAEPDTNASAPARTTSTPETFTADIFPECRSTGTQQLLIPDDYQTSISSLLESLASRLAPPASVKGLMMPEAHSFLRSLGCSKPSDHAFVSLKTCQAYSVTQAGRLLPESSRSWMGWGMTRSGWCLTLRAGPLSKENDLTLSAVLEPPERVPEKYYISEKALRGLVAHKKRHKAKGHNFGFRVLTPDQKCNTLLARDGEGGAMRYVIDMEKAPTYRSAVPRRPDQKMNTLMAHTHGQAADNLIDVGLVRVATFNRGGRGQTVYDADGLACTLTSGNGIYGEPMPGRASIRLPTSERIAWLRGYTIRPARAEL